ncbi:TPA: glucosyltransferase [Escherichia coli]|nr:glucosyltransferase [Escherichia coli]HAH2732600.1 glucosyltransferase [Escherichia coli]HAH3009328.1 glucosyltransferase [Escherichia coli]HAH3033867.1 glucosyltransferase [Escherichia coli]
MNGLKTIYNSSQVLKIFLLRLIRKPISALSPVRVHYRY